MKIRLALLICLGVVRSSLAADDVPPKTLDELKQRITTIVEKREVPALGIALVNRDGPYWVAGIGKADLKSGRAADEDTLFRIGSISKMFAALAVLKLVEEGKLALDDKLSDRAPDVAFENAWEKTHPVRIAHLLEHTTGWDDIHLPEYAYAAPDAMTVKQALDFHPDSRASRWPPGTRHAYCNSGAAVAAYVVEKVTGQRFEDYVAKEFFAPLGMESTSYFKTKLYDERGATLYQGDKPQEYWQILVRPAGSINSSARDMAKFVHFLLLRGSTSTGPILSKASFDRMETPGTLPGNAAGVLAGYGLGNYSTGHSIGVAFRGHDGGVNGGLSHLAYVDPLGEGYVLMINSGNGSALGEITTAIRDFLLRNAKPPEVIATALPARYKTIDGYYQSISPRNDSIGLLTSVFGILKVTHDDKLFHRSPLMPSWTSDDHVGAREVLVDRWSGLPTIAVVEDPLVGPALQVGSDLLQRVPAWMVFARLGTVALTILMSLVGFIAFIVWAARRGRKKTSDGRLWLRLWPLMATATLISYLFASAVSGSFLQWLGTISPMSVGLFLLSLVYPGVVLLGVAHLFTSKARERLNLPYWFAATFLLVHILVASYLARHGGLGMRTWA
ncbi:MAG: beta-lactamase family protein [Steroidobacteraceae bacterium]|nr:beta-lactamase family protein [Steroidobacteraceae bacterium]